MMSKAGQIMAQLKRTNAMSNWHTDDYITTANTNDLVYYTYNEIGNRPV